MAMDWKALLDAAGGPDESARAGAIIRAQAELERLLSASGWARQDGESLLQRIVRARQQADVPWISDDIGWAIQLRNRIAHEGLQPNPRDALRALHAYQDAALKLIPPSPSPSPSSSEKEKPARTRKRVVEDAEEVEEPKPRKRRSPKGEAGKKPPPSSSSSVGGFLAALVVVVGMLLGVWGLARWSQGPRAPTGLRSWVLPAGASASSAAAGQGAEQAVDGDPRTAWCEGVTGVGVGERLTLSLPAEGVWVEAVRLKGGEQRDQRHLEQSRAPARLTVIAGPHAIASRLSPSLGRFEEIALPEAVQVRSLTLVVEEVGPGASTHTCLSEVEVRIRR